jgi:rubrerythrin
MTAPLRRPERVTWKLCERLEQLIALEQDAIDAYDEALDRMANGVFRQQLTDFRADHVRHACNLTEGVEQLGVRHGASGRRCVATSRVRAADRAGDRAVLHALYAAESETQHAYEDTLERYRPVAPQAILALLQRGVANEQRHGAWLTQVAATSR